MRFTQSRLFSGWEITSHFAALLQTIQSGDDLMIRLVVEH